MQQKLKAKQLRRVGRRIKEKMRMHCRQEVWMWKMHRSHLPLRTTLINKKKIKNSMNMITMKNPLKLHLSLKALTLTQKPKKSSP
eukprot:1324898-Ditylum_brightwellii.AAC.1